MYCDLYNKEMDNMTAIVYCPVFCGVGHVENYTLICEHLKGD